MRSNFGLSFVSLCKQVDVTRGYIVFLVTADLFRDHAELCFHPVCLEEQKRLI